MKWVLIELSCLVILTPLFILFAPRHGGLYMLMALLFLVYIAGTAHLTKRQIWDLLPVNPELTPRHLVILIALLTLFIAAGFCIWGSFNGYSIWQLNLWLAMGFYCLWAFVQQSIFQFYFLGRLLLVFRCLQPVCICAINGLAFGLVHLPKVELVLVTIIAGFVWSYVYWRNRILWPLALSHGILATLFYYMVLEDDLWARLIVMWRIA